MSRDDGFAIADTDSGMLSDPKVLALARGLRDSIRTGAAVALYDAVRLASWKAGRRLTLEEAVPGWWLDPFDDLAAALVSADLVDDEHRIPAHAWASWFGPARDRRQHFRDLGRKGGRASVERALDRALDRAPEPVVERTLKPVPSLPSGRHTVPADGWGPRAEAWAGFAEAWQGRGLRLPPTEAQRVAMWPMVDARPQTAAQVIRDAPADTSASDLVGLVLKRWREAQRSKAPAVDVHKYDHVIESGPGDSFGGAEL